jgi:predicted MPP superfamily phosphohydrolase
MPPAALRRAFDRLLSLGPDVILLGGDIATARLSEIFPHLDAFRSLRAPLGTFAVLGNHDHYTGEPARLSALLEENGIRVLTNRWAPIERDGARLSIAGIDDLVVGRPDLDAALDGAPPPTVLLSHNPDIFFDAARRGVALVLSGHTHGGRSASRACPSWSGRAATGWTRAATRRRAPSWS